jgi:hypothetical protein
MKTHIYYPGMEVRDELWLKFALLYLERLAFVFTVSEKSGLTALLETLRQQTDLLAEPPQPAFFAHITPQVRARLPAWSPPTSYVTRCLATGSSSPAGVQPPTTTASARLRRDWSGCTGFV